MSVTLQSMIEEGKWFSLKKTGMWSGLVWCGGIGFGGVCICVRESEFFLIGVCLHVHLTFCRNDNDLLVSLHCQSLTQSLATIIM